MKVLEFPLISLPLDPDVVHVGARMEYGISSFLYSIISWRGEMTLVVRGAVGDRVSKRDRDLRSEIKKLRKEGMRVKEIAELLGERFSLSKREIYRMVLEGGENINHT